MGLIRLSRDIVMLLAVLVSMFSIGSVAYASDTVYIGDNVLVRVVHLEATYTSRDLGVCGVTYVRVGMDMGTKIKLPKGYPKPEPITIVEQSKIADEYITNATATVLGLSRGEFRVKLVHDGRTIYVAIIISESRNTLEDENVGYKYLEMIQELQRMLGVVLVIYVYPVPDQLYSSDLETVKRGVAKFTELIREEIVISRMIKNGVEPKGPPEVLELMQALDNMGESYTAWWYSREPPYAVYIDVAVHDVNSVRLEDIKRFVKAVRSAIGCSPPLDIAIFEGWYVSSFSPHSGGSSAPTQGNVLVDILRGEQYTSTDRLGELDQDLPDNTQEATDTSQPLNSTEDLIDTTQKAAEGKKETQYTLDTLAISVAQTRAEASSAGEVRGAEAQSSMIGGIGLLVAAVFVIAVFSIARR